MSDLKALAIQPKEYFELMKEENLEKREPIKLRYLLITFIVLSVVNSIVQSKMIPVEPIEGIDIPQIFTSLKYVGYVIFPLLGTWIWVNIVCLVNKALISSIEHKEIEDKKYFKSLLYYRYLVTSILTLILGIVTSFILKDIEIITIVNSINNLFTGILSVYILHGILKYYIETQKLHKILPVVYYIFTIIGAVAAILLTKFSSNLPL
jgi:hypothetical protein